MKESTLKTLAPLIAALRGYSMLDEVKPATFYLNGRDFVHFHDESEGLFADVLLSGGRVRMAVSSASDQAELLERIARKLTSLESNSSGKRQRKRPGYGRNA